MTPLQARLDRATATRPLLAHPFYEAWAAGTLTVDDLAFYSTQYWRQVEAFPGYLETVSRRVPAGPVRDTILTNLADERDGDHPQLWLDFAQALGLDETTVRSSDAVAETRSCVESFRSASAVASPAFALGMLYGYESQTPAVAETKVAGLRDHYGIDGGGAGYFELHGELDVEHSNDMAAAIDQIATDDAARADAESGARSGAEAIWQLLDGVARVRGIGC
ncbi:MAG TPA: iron-containing redox enzyme family protein [Actinomycetota bacterium]|nr:iron-containing redox enzyme family protein [Actinomycetota bacterium]